MNTTFLNIFLLQLTTLFPGNWEKSTEKEGVIVYTRTVEGYNLKEFKGVVIAKTTLSKALEMLKEPAKYQDWMHNTSESKMVRKDNENDFYFYHVNDAPWPVSDRDNVTRMEISKPTSGSYQMKTTAYPDVLPEVSGKIRVRYMKGFWLLEDLGNGTVRITEQAHADPGGSLPAWLVNSSVIDTPLYTLINLKKRLESR